MRVLKLSAILLGLSMAFQATASDTTPRSTAAPQADACKAEVGMDGQKREPSCCGQCTTSDGKKGCSKEENGKKSCQSC